LKSYFLIVFITFCTILNAQNEQIVDSLKQLTQQDKVQDTIKVKAYNDLGIQYANSNPDLAKQYINNALILATKADSKRGVAGAYNCLGVVDYYQKNYDEALVNFQKALKINEELEYTWGQASALNQIGAVQNLKDDYNAAIHSFEKAGEIFEIMKDSLSWAKSIQNIGLSYSRMGYHEKSIEYNLKAIELYKTINNPEGTARVYVSIATILYKQKDCEKSVEYLDKALLFVKNTDNINLLSAILRKKGSNYSYLKDYEKALYYYQEALDCYKDSENKKKTRSILSYLGLTYYRMQNYNKALQYQKEAIKYYDVSTNNRETGRVYYETSKTYLKLNQLNQATSYATKALEISKSVGYLKGQKNAYHTLALIAQQQGRNEKALQLFIDYDALNDSLSAQEKQQQVRKLTTIYENEKLNTEIIKQDAEIKLLESDKLIERSKKNILYTILIGSFLLMAGLTYYLLERAKRKRKAFAEQLTRSKQELNDFTKQLLIKSKEQDILKKEFDTLKSLYGEKEELIKLQELADSKILTNEDWGHFKAKFSSVYPHFFINFKNKGFKFSSGEERLITLEKLELKTNEIANMLGISSESVLTSRYRLRKKLEPPKDINIIDFLESK
jgi:tetratricopeptide (TPR) repeat protein